VKIGKKIRQKLKWLLVVVPFVVISTLLLLLRGEKANPKDDLFEDKK
jgi:hypothetical protein